MSKGLPIAIIAIIIIGGITVYAVSPYFTESTIDEAIPEGAIIESKTDDAMMGDEEMMMEGDEEMMMEGDEEMMMEGDEEMMMEGDESVMSDTMADQMITDPSSEFEMTVRSYVGDFVGVNDGIHNAEGTVYTIPLEDGSSVLRLEEFRSTNGPGLYLYLSTDTRATDYISLGKLKANQGNQNYVIPDGTDLDKYNKVLVWCEPFSVLFGSAALSTQ